jgi:hypothetical protein
VLAAFALAAPGNASASTSAAQPSDLCETTIVSAGALDAIKTKARGLLLRVAQFAQESGPSWVQATGKSKPDKMVKGRTGAKMKAQKALKLKPAKKTAR